MRRWHAERDLMLRRWRQEIAIHEQSFGGEPKSFSHYGLAPIPPGRCNMKCHCYLGPGFMRKRRPHGGGCPRCGVCHPEKRWYRQSERARAKREWRRVEFELAY